MELFDDVGEGWTLTEALEVKREIEGPAPLTSYRTPPARIVPCDPILRWGLLVVASLDEAADELDHTAMARREVVALEFWAEERGLVLHETCSEDEE